METPKVRCKFVYQGIETWQGPQGYISRKMRFGVVYSSDPNSENKKFWDATPGGLIELTTVNENAVKAFEIGKEYYVDFTPAN